ncbi:MAG: cellulose biosynthesis cyclic di-GMP-binding regulatory protein BcsB, partial [Phyllobacteriaceae bacterium]|nr:cellulose biosynthesis cyclic di-GMP-binding regulatory protein BcsB [Phyllobacteriaceae bacterium]
AVMVAPEASRLDVLINSVALTATPIAASASPASLSIHVPSGVLRRGANTIEFRATQRHRTDCSIASTYELWTRLTSDSVTLTFEGENLGQIVDVTDLAAIGVDAKGTTTVRVLAPDFINPDATNALMRLIQQLAIALRVAELRIELVDELTAPPTPGTLDLVVAPFGGLPKQFSALREQAAGAGVASMDSPVDGNPTLVVSGPGWPDIMHSIEAMAPSMAGADRPRIDLGRTLVRVDGHSETSLANLAVTTTEFNGRRYADQFQFDLPHDFYANRYGQMELVLDAAYSADVLPGSEIDFYVNGQIASATPLLRTDGGLLRDTIIRIPMKSLQPGRNVVDVAVNLLTESDQVCSPGWTGTAPTRFVFSASSALRMPMFAQATTEPDLRTLAANGMPYADRSNVQLVISDDKNARIAAMVMLARMAAAAGKVLPVTTVPEAALSPSDDAIVIKPLSEMSSVTMTRVGLSTGASEASGDERVLTQFGSGRPGGPLAPAINWVLDTAGLSMDDLRVLPGRQSLYAPPPGSITMTQLRQPEGGLWTAVASPDANSLISGTPRMIQLDTWRKVAGWVSSLNGDQLVVQQPFAVHVATSDPFNLVNLRLVAANWFSGHILSFTGLLTLAAVLLMFATSPVLTQIGRRK